MADLDMQPLDIVYMVTDELETNDSELSLQIKAYARAHAWAVRTDVLDILYDQHSTGTFTFSDVLPVLKYMKQVITNSRPLKTTDYITPSEADGVANDYDLSEFYGRLTTTRSAINGYISTLNSENTAFTSPAATNFTQVRNALKKFSMFGIEQTTYEYTDNNSDDYTALKSYTTAVLKEANKRLAAFDAVVPANPATPPADVDAFISAGTDAAKALFGKQFNILPLFKVRSTESTVFSSLLTTGFGTLKSDHATNNYLMDEWVSGIAKVRKNAASYEMLTILSSLIDPDAFDGDRNLVPLQTPYATDGTERWLGAAVTNTTALKDGRLSIGISVPGNPASYDIAGWQVGIMIDEWIDVIPSTDETTGIAFHFNQPNAKPPQCLLLGLTPDIKGSWHWSDLVDMINETFDLAKKRAVTYEQLSATPVAQLSPAFMVPFTAQYSTIGFTAIDLQ